MYTDRTVAWLFDGYSKVETFSGDIYYVVNSWGQLIVGDLENGWKDDDEHVGRLFGFRFFKVGYWKGL